jgi:hypothetical protein
VRRVRRDRRVSISGDYILVVDYDSGEQFVVSGEEVEALGLRWGLDLGELVSVPDSVLRARYDVK